MELISTFVWYLVISGPQGGMVVMPSGFDTREQCQDAIVEYQKQPGAGWQLQCIPSGAAYYPDDPGVESGPAEAE